MEQHEELSCPALWSRTKEALYNIEIFSQEGGMSHWSSEDDTVPQLYLILLLCSVYTGIAKPCPFCCVQLQQDRGVNCTWRDRADTQSTLEIQSLKFHPDPSSRMTFQTTPGQNWLVISREKLTINDQYELRLEMESRVYTLTLTYSQDGENVFLKPPTLSLVEPSDDDMAGVEVTWSHSHDVPTEQNVELRYRRLGDRNWTEADHSDLQVTSYEMDELEPYTEYEVQIRYQPDEPKKMKSSSWSDSFIFRTPEEVPSGSIDVWRRSDQGPFLFVLWKPLEPQSARGNILSYQLDYFHEGLNYTISESCCDAKLPANSTQVCLRAKNSKGLGPSTCVPPQCSGKPPPVSILTNGDQAGGINVLWGPPLKSLHEPTTYIVEWTEVTQSGNAVLDWTRHPASTQNARLTGELAPYVPYRVSLYVLYHNSCAGPLSTIAYSLEGVPSAAPNFSISNISSTDVFISWDELPVWQLRGILTNYTVHLNNTETVQRHTVFGRNLSLSGLSPRSSYNIWMTASTNAGDGRPGRVVTFHTRDKIFTPLLVVYVIGFVILAAALLNPYSQRALRSVCWPKIPKPKEHLLMFIPSHVYTLCNTSYSKVSHDIQMSSNTPISLVEQLDPRVSQHQETSIVWTQDSPTVLPQESSTVLPQDSPTVLPQESSTVLPQESSTVLPQESSTVLPQELSTVLPQAPSTILPQEPSTVFPQASSTILPQEPSTVLPQEPLTELPQEPFTFSSQYPPIPIPQVPSLTNSGYEKHFMPTPEEVMGLY